MIHALYLEALMSQTDWSLKDIAFQGGTSLRFSWKSIRFSEDLDFLLSKSVQGTWRRAQLAEHARRRPGSNPCFKKKSTEMIRVQACEFI